jgi:hypothetical protein
MSSYAELAAQVTAARAIADDYSRVVDGFIDHDGADPPWQTMYFRLQCELRRLAHGLAGALDDQQQAAGEAARLTAIRTVLCEFDWENDDRQLALERIDSIADGGAA